MIPHGSVHPKILRARALVMAERRRAKIRGRIEQQRLRSIAYRSRVMLGVTLTIALGLFSICSVLVGLTWSIWWPLVCMIACCIVSSFFLSRLFDPDFVDPIHSKEPHDRLHQ